MKTTVFIYVCLSLATVHCNLRCDHEADSGVLGREASSRSEQRAAEYPEADLIRLGLVAVELSLALFEVLYIITCYCEYIQDC